MTCSTMLWRRIDTPGHDACRLDADDDGGRLDGSAVYCLDDVPVRLDYHVDYDAAWSTRGGMVRGWVGTAPVALSVTRPGNGRWLLNAVEVAGLEGCVDLDFGFTPATNLSLLRRIALAVGDAAEVPVAWLDVPVGTLRRLDQRYERVAERAYAYEAPHFGYRAVLEVDGDGFIRVYPGLWVAEC